MNEDTTPQAPVPEQTVTSPEQPAVADGGQITYFVERQFLKLVGATVRTFDVNRNLLCKAEQKAFKLREQVPFYADEAKTTPLFQIKARNIIDIAATYDITTADGERIGALKRKGLASAFVRDEWLILNGQDQEIGLIAEDSALLGVLRRYVDFVALFVPQKFTVTVSGQEIAHMQQNKNPFTVKLTCTYEPQAPNLLGNVLVLAIPSMLAIIEARQN